MRVSVFLIYRASPSSVLKPSTNQKGRGLGFRVSSVEMSKNMMDGRPMGK